MIGRVLLCAGLLAIPGSSAAGQIQVAWNDCLSDGGAQTRTFACNTNSGFSRLVVSYTPTASVPDFVTVDGTLDLFMESGLMIPPWWEFKNAGACRMADATIDISVFDLPNLGAGCLDTWDGGASATGLFTGYTVGFWNIAARARAVFAIARAASNPTSISQGTTYFAWTWQISNANTLSCAGCADPAVLWSETMRVSGLSGISGLTLTASPDDGESCVGWNGGSACAAVPARTATWGKVKAMYR